MLVQIRRLLRSGRRRENFRCVGRWFSDATALDHKTLRAPAGLRAVAVCECLREFSAQEKDLSRIVNPDDQDYDGGRGAVSGGKAGLTQVNSECQLANGK